MKKTHKSTANYCCLQLTVTSRFWDNSSLLIEQSERQGWNILIFKKYQQSNTTCCSHIVFTCVLSKHNGCHFELLGLNTFIHKVLNKEKWRQMLEVQKPPVWFFRSIYSRLQRPLHASSVAACTNANINSAFCTHTQKWLKQQDQCQSHKICATHFKDIWIK